jgi:filamin
VEWTNQYLRPTGDQIQNLVTDFHDGVKLIRLVEALTGKKVARYNRNPRFRSQKIDNITIAISALEREWGLSAVGVDPSGTTL